MREAREGGNYEAIVVLGAQVKPDGTPSVQLQWRKDNAKQAYDLKNVPIVVCGGQGGDEPMPEAECMKRYLTEQGVPPEMILMDPESVNTIQNLKNAGELLQNAGYGKNVLIVTSDYHVPRATAMARDVGLTAEGLGSPCLKEYWIKNHIRETLAWIKYWGMKIFVWPVEGK